MQITKQRRVEVIGQFGGNEKNAGSAEAQVAMLTERINHISGHLSDHKKDHHTSRSLLRLVGQRKKLLKYLHDNNLTSYRQLIEKLNLRK